MYCIISYCSYILYIIAALYSCLILALLKYFSKYLTLSFHVILQKELARLITKEQGKTHADAEGDVLRGLRECCLKNHIVMYFMDTI